MPRTWKELKEASHLAERLEQAQGNVSRTLRRADPHLSTLRELIAALGGELELVARFEDRSYAIRMSAGE